MAETNFVDYVKIFCRSGKGGRGSTHFRREKYIPKGGPDGGNGGDGGNIILRGNRNYWTLLHLKFQRHIFAGHGEGGSRRNSSGKRGESKVIEVPCGTVAYDAHTGEYLCDITDDGQEVVLLKQFGLYDVQGELKLQKVYLLTLFLLQHIQFFLHLD